MGREHRQYTDDFKREAVRLYESGAKSAREIEDELGIGRGRIHRWRRQYRDEGTAGGVSSEAPADLAAEVRRLRRELAEAREERDILKKAVQVFSKDPKR